MRLAIPLNPFRLARKADAWRPRTRDDQTPRKIVEVRSVQPAEATCISIDAPDHLFLTAGCIPTHNSIADDAKASFPAAVNCVTAHALAYRAIGHRYKERLNGPRVPAGQAARILGIHYSVTIDDKVFQPAQLARLANETVARFCHSADEEPASWHVPVVTGLEQPEQRRAVEESVYPLAVKVWEDVRQVKGQLRFTHDCYLKLFGLSKPQLPYDYILYDEAQDANAVTLRIVRDQDDAQIVAVGDPSQAIYGWRGASDSLGQFDAKHRLHLSQSFRFGPAIAAEANKWLDLLDAELRVEGFARVNSTVGPLAVADAVLCRTNAGAIGQVMAAIAAGQRAALVGGGDDMRRLAEAAVDLKAGRGTSHPELFAFRTWAEVQDHAENDPGGSDLKVFVNLVDKHGPDVIIDTLSRLTRDESRADVVISTAHKAKGREWRSVQIATDFREPKETEDGKQGQIQRPEMMLSYVAVTRAKLALDPAGVAWVGKYLKTPSSCP